MLLFLIGFSGIVLKGHWRMYIVCRHSLIHIVKHLQFVVHNWTRRAAQTALGCSGMTGQLTSWVHEHLFEVQNWPYQLIMRIHNSQRLPSLACRALCALM